MVAKEFKRKMKRKNHFRNEIKVIENYNFAFVLLSIL